MEITWTVPQCISGGGLARIIEAPCSPPEADGECARPVVFPVRLWRTTGRAGSVHELSVLGCVHLSIDEFL